MTGADLNVGEQLIISDLRETFRSARSCHQTFHPDPPPDPGVPEMNTGGGEILSRLRVRWVIVTLQGVPKKVYYHFWVQIVFNLKITYAVLFLDDL